MNRERWARAVEWSMLTLIVVGVAAFVALLAIGITNGA